MKILNLKLRGSIGIRKGLGIEEIEIDFTQFQSGLIALTGRNGSGKTTIMENLHPYRCMVSRDGSLQSHFFLKDSYRILEFEMNGYKYKSQILIDALTGGSEAYLSIDQFGGNGWEPLNDGKLTSYDIKIETVLGSQDLFFNSVFSGQKSKGIAELKPADRRKLFYELLNLNIYETYLDQAKTELKKQEIRLAEIEGEIKAISTVDISFEELDSNRLEVLQNINNLISEIDNNQKYIDGVAETNKRIEIEIRVNTDRLAENDTNEKTIKKLQQEILIVTNEDEHKSGRYNDEIRDWEKLIDRNIRLVGNKGKIESELKRKVELAQQLSEHKEIGNEFQKEFSLLQKDYSAQLKQMIDQEKVLETKRLEYNSLGLQIEDNKRNISRTESDIRIITEVPCNEETGASCKFLLNAYQSKINLENLLKLDAEFKANYERQKKSLGNFNKLINDSRIDLDSNYQAKQHTITATIDANDITIKHFEEQIRDIDKNNWEKLQKEASEAENLISSYKTKIENNLLLIEQSKEFSEKQIDSLKNNITDLLAKIDIHITARIHELRNNLNNGWHKLELEKEKLDELKNNRQQANSNLINIENQMAQIKKNEEKVLLLNDDKKKIESEIKDWAFLSKAFDKTGIPVLKLENSGIEITTIANELLAMFENKFRIIFETTSLTKDKKKMKETFDINIIEDDGVCEIGNKSGGQQVWLETAIQLAISLVVRQQGRNIQTSFLDEKDGALDLENAFSYIEMLRKAHDLSGVHNTFIITHRPELLDFIPQQIKLNNGILEIIN